MEGAEFIANQGVSASVSAELWGELLCQRSDLASPVLFFRDLLDSQDRGEAELHAHESGTSGAGRESHGMEVEFSPLVS